MTPPGQDNRDNIQFASVDSAPKKFAGMIPQWRALHCLGGFSVVSLALLFSVNSAWGEMLFPNHDLVFSPYFGNHAIAIRIFLVSFYIAFAAICSGPTGARLLFGSDMVLTFLVICAIMDLANVTCHSLFDVSYSLHFSAIGSGLIGFAIYSFKLLQRGFMPARIFVEHRPVTMKRAIIRLTATALIAAICAMWVAGLGLPIVEELRRWTLLGGIGPSVFLFLPLFFAQLYLLAIWDVLRAKKPKYAPPVSIIVPAHNEEYIIRNTILAMDKAAAHYGGDVRILIINNNSTDATEQIARDTLDACKAATGDVINVPLPGKSNALNAGLDAVQTEFFIRVDADTLVGEDNLSRALPFFLDPDVGVVGGVPIPPGGAVFDRARLLEVLVKHGFYSVAMGAVNGVVGIPRMFVVMRTHHPRYLGGFVEGMNGEDTDLSLRIGELGFYAVVDPKLRYVSEVPATYQHMREQRMRWFRSVYHISSRCRDLIYSRNLSLRGKLILPYMLVNSARRAMLVPLILFGAMECTFRFNADSPIVSQAVVAVTTGAPAMVALAASVLNQVPRGILALPEYLIFRVLRAYFTLESMLSILIDNQAEDLERATKLGIEKPGLVRVA